MKVTEETKTRFLVIKDIACEGIIRNSIVTKQQVDVHISAVVLETLKMISEYPTEQWVGILVGLVHLLDTNREKPRNEIELASWAEYLRGRKEG